MWEGTSSGTKSIKNNFIRFKFQRRLAGGKRCLAEACESGVRIIYWEWCISPVGGKTGRNPSSPTGERETWEKKWGGGGEWKNKRRIYYWRSGELRLSPAKDLFKESHSNNGNWKYAMLHCAKNIHIKIILYVHTYIIYWHSTERFFHFHTPKIMYSFKKKKKKMYALRTHTCTYAKSRGKIYYTDNECLYDPVLSKRGRFLNKPVNLQMRFRIHICGPRTLLTP